MSRKRKPPAEIRYPRDDQRFYELAFEGPQSWYARHVVECLTCLCGTDGPAVDCDAGHALYRLAAAAVLGRLDARGLESIL